MRWSLFVFILFLLAGCQPETPGSVVASAVSTAVPPTVSPTKPPTLPPPPPTLPPPPPTPTQIPTATLTPTPLATATATATPTATPVGACGQRLLSDYDLLATVTLTYSLSRDYAPGDLVKLSEYLPNSITLGYPTEVRKIMINPLVAMINDMLAAGLAPEIISGYRSYSAQAIAWDKWNRQYPERAHIISAPPGYSEHQLGTTIDFGSPELAEIIGEDLQFHTYFYQTSEGQWLLENAHRYGFTLSYPREAFDLTGFYYEPWHYRYVGVELATQLFEANQFLTQYQFERQPEPPCIPEENE